MAPLPARAALWPAHARGGGREPLGRGRWRRGPGEGARPPAPSVEGRLPDRRAQPVPLLARGVHLADVLDDDGDGQVNVVGVDEPHGDPREAGKGAVDGVVGEDLAVDPVARVGGDRADHVGRVDVLDVHVREVVLHLLLEPLPDVAQDAVARGVRLVRRGGQHVLPRALGHADDGVPLPGDDALQVGEQALLPVEREGDLGDEAHIHDARGERRVEGDEARLAPHELDDADPPEGAARLDLGGEQRALGLLDGRLKAEAAVDEQDVVVDRLWDTDHGAHHAPLLALGLDGCGARVAAVAANHKQHVHPPHVELLHDLLDVRPAPGGAEHRAPLQVKALDVLPGQDDGRELGVVEPAVAVAHPQDVPLLHAIVLELPDEARHHVVQARAKAAARHDGRGGRRRVVEDGIPRARPHRERRQRDVDLLQGRLHPRRPVPRRADRDHVRACAGRLG
mmetsp:Transcript_25298/g.60183  ORF Transcript_25298/g.60183 Transcript_25298/m.60183 type:complete len:453 (+) Transcript_25298:394-1752(+)